jgi:hypothetical protein
MSSSGKGDIIPIASWDIGVFASSKEKNIELNAGQITVGNNEKDLISTIVDIPQKLDLVEFRLFYHGKGDLMVHSIKVERI